LHNRAVFDSAPTLRSNALFTFADSYSLHPETLPRLIERATNDAAPSVRLHAAEYLLKRWSHEAYTFLRTRGEEETDSEIKSGLRALITPKNARDKNSGIEKPSALN